MKRSAGTRARLGVQSRHGRVLKHGHGDTGNLVLGWRLDGNGDPEYWMSPGERPRPGAQSDSSLLTLPAESLGSNTIIVAQSGSGKSSFLSRIVEELLLSSSAHCLIIDPNSDFRYFPEVGSTGAWTAVSYNPTTHSGRLHTEKSAAEFKRRWSKIKHQITILTGGIPGPLSSPTMRRPTVGWRYLPQDFLTDGLDSVHRVEMRHCHTFFKSLAEIYETGLRLRSRASVAEEDHLRGSLDILRKVEPVFSSLAEARSENRLHGSEGILRLMEEELGQRMQLPGARAYSAVRTSANQTGSKEDLQHRREDFYYRRIARNLEKAAVAFGHFTDVTGRHYFGLLEDLHAEGILSDKLVEPSPRRVEILDLPSIKLRSTRNLLVASLLDLAIARATDEWESARAQVYTEPDSRPTRRPFFIILDEAHNFIPADDAAADSSLKLVRDRFRTIAAEGRKLGLFLILATQRPDKIDKFVLSECQNKAIMRLDSEASLSLVADALGMQDAKNVMRKRCVGTGYRALLTGRWTDYVSVPIYPAPRRTMEGGGSLDTGHWAPSEQQDS